MFFQKLNHIKIALHIYLFEVWLVRVLSSSPEMNPSLNTNTNYRCPGQNKFIFKCNKNNETPGIQSPVPELAMALVTCIGLGVEL